MKESIIVARGHYMASLGIEIVKKLLVTNLLLRFQIIFMAERFLYGKEISNKVFWVFMYIMTTRIF